MERTVVVPLHLVGGCWTVVLSECCGLLLNVATARRHIEPDLATQTEGLDTLTDQAVGSLCLT